MTTIEIAAIALAVAGWVLAAVLYREIRRPRGSDKPRYKHPMNDLADEIEASYRGRNRSI